MLDASALFRRASLLFDESFPVFIEPIHTTPMYCVYADGSANKERTKLGIGWVVEDIVTDELFSYQQALKIIDDMPLEEQNQVAEIIAVIDALETIPKGSNIHVFTDFYDAEYFMRSGGQKEPYRQTNVPKRIWERFKNAMDRHREVTSEYASDKSGRIRNKRTVALMKWVHNLASNESGSKKYNQLSALEHHLIGFNIPEIDCRFEKF